MKIEHELKDGTIDETNINEYSEDLIAKILERFKKYVCKIY